MSSEFPGGSSFAPPHDGREPEPSSIGERYQILERLGRGGMAVVYRVRDMHDGRELALKQVLPQTVDRDRTARAHFEREFYLLAQLSHPSVIEVYDYGIDRGYPYYTMELLDGGDLSARAPLPARSACELMVQLCSSLSLLHSRRLVHRDISPRNVRCTRSGHAKLIDFGAMVPMGPCDHSVGTPSFVAPEVLHHLTLDARTDLFSLGATLYYALSGKKPFAARSMADLNDAWRHEPTPPSQLVPGIAPALDALVLSLLRIDPARRPLSAFEVMQRLTAIAGITQAEPEQIAQGYLHAPALVGREAHLRHFRRLLRKASGSAGGTLLFEGEAGLGRTRLLEVCAIEAKLSGATVVHVDARALTGVPLQAALRVAEQLRIRAPDSIANRKATLGELSKWVRTVCERRALVLVFDDLERIDDASLGWIASLAHEANELKLVLLAALAAAEDISSRPALEVLRNGAFVAKLEPWSAAQTEALFASMFSGAPQVALVSHRVHKVAAGNPRESMTLAHHLLERRVIRYVDGNWALPTELALADLPLNAEDAVRARIAQLPPLARRLAEYQALAFEAPFSREDHATLAGATESVHVGQALELLVQRRVLACNDNSFSLSHVGVRAHLVAELNDEEQRQRHRDLAALCVRTGRAAIAEVHHLLNAGSVDHALARLTALFDATREVAVVYQAPGVERKAVVAVLERARALSEARGRPARERHELSRRLLELSLTTSEALYARYAPALLAQLEHDSGYSDYVSDTGDAAASARLSRALERAAARHAATPSHDRVYQVDEAIGLLGHFVLISAAIAARTLDTALYASLPEKLEPFRGLSPVLAAAQQLVRAGCDLNYGAKPERARELLHAAYASVAGQAAANFPYAANVPYQIALSASVSEVMLGSREAEHWIGLSEQHPLYRLGGLTVRRLLCVYDGDSAAAERTRRQFDLLAIETEGRGVFTARPALELSAQLHADDLAGVKQAAHRIAQLAQRFPGWVPWHHYAQGGFHRLCGDAHAALTALERALLASDPAQLNPPPQLGVWLYASALYVTLLTELDRASEARAFGDKALERCAVLGIAGSAAIERALALAEAKLGQHARAVERLNALIAQRSSLRPSFLAADYEARAQVAIAARDAEAAARFIALALAHRGPDAASNGAGSIGRMLDEAKQSGLQLDLVVSELESAVLASERKPSAVRKPHAALADFARLPNAKARALRALELLAQAAGARAGYLYYITGERVFCAARLDAAPNQMLDGLAESYVAEQRERAAMTTIFTDMNDAAEPNTLGWIDPNGTPHRIARLQHEPSDRCVALVVLRGIEEHAFGSDCAALADALALHLVELGDIPSP